MKKKLKLGLFGFGCVGQGLYHVLNETHGVKAEIKKICIRDKDKTRPIPAHFFTTERSAILDDGDIDIVVELIDDAAAAFEIVSAALKKGKAVVTANKKMVAEHLEELFDLQQRFERPVLYEGAVCGSIPIIRNLEEYYDNDLISSVEGIFNGSTNYILTRVLEDRKTYAEALSQAQALGFAESDPALDVEGFDPKYKLVIAIAHTFGLFVKPEEVFNIGIDKVSAVDLKFARENNYTIKLVARAFRENGKVYGFVAPQFVATNSPLANVRNEFNAVQVKGAFAETQLFIGKGAGGYPTGSAVLSDISALSYRYAYEYKKRRQETGLEFSNDLRVEAFVSFDEEHQVGSDDFEVVRSGYAARGKRYMVGTLKLPKAFALAQRKGVGVILAPDQVAETVALDNLAVA